MCQSTSHRRQNLYIGASGTYIHTYIHTYINTYVHTYIHTYINTYVRTYIKCYQDLVYYRLQIIVIEFQTPALFLRVLCVLPTSVELHTGSSGWCDTSDSHSESDAITYDLNYQ